MIVVSGALVVLSIILLVTGLVASDDLTLIYISIGSSVLAGIFLLLGALQRRDSKPSAAAAAPEASTAAFERVTTVNVTKAPTTAGASSAAAASAGSAGSAVSVVPGRPRFHTDDCRFLAGRPDVESIAADDARAQGYTECGVCKPSESMAAGAPTRSTTPALMNDDDVSAQADDALDNEIAATTRRGGSGRTAATRTAATRTASTRTASTRTASTRTASTTAARAAKAAPARSTATRASKPATKAAAGRTAVTAAGRTAAKAAPAKAALKSSTRAAAKAAPAKAAPARTAAKAAPARTAAKVPSKTTRAAAKSTPAGSVVVIPDRDKYHTGECRFVRDVDGTLTVSKATARRQGYIACGVCKP